MPLRGDLIDSRPSADCLNKKPPPIRAGVFSLWVECIAENDAARICQRFLNRPYRESIGTGPEYAIHKSRGNGRNVSLRA
jgi:hypothetical protein